MRYLNGMVMCLCILMVVSGCSGLKGDKPPLPTVKVGKSEVQVVRASYCWDKGCSDTAGPPDILEGVAPTKVSAGEEISIAFKKRPRPSTFSISRINEQGGIKETARDEGLRAPDIPGVYYYDMFAQWLSKDKKYSEGDSYYAFVIEVGELGHEIGATVQFEVIE